MTVNAKDERERVEKIFAAFNESWLIYWDAYVELQNQLYQSMKAAREVSWLAATDTDKVSRINMAQRELFASMPRRMDYSPLGDITRNMDNAMRRLKDLEDAMVAEKAKCLRLIDAIEVIQEKIATTKQGLQACPEERALRFSRKMRSPYRTLLKAIIGTLYSSHYSDLRVYRQSSRMLSFSSFRIGICSLSKRTLLVRSRKL